jgi:AraC-like DNA-binding protein
LSARIGAMIVYSAAASGVKSEELENATGFRAASASDPDARIPLAMETALWEEAAKRTGDTSFGIHTAERLQPGQFDVLDYVIRTAPSPRVAVERVVRYNRLEHDIAVFSIADRGAITRIEHAFGDGRHVQSRHAAEFTLASLIVFGSQITGTRMLPRAVEFTHARPAATSEHVRLFGVEPRFRADVNALEWDRDVLDRPNPTADPALARTILRHADSLLAALPEATTSYADRVRRILADKLGEGDATLVSAARQLKMSERSLQRRLSADGVTFDALLDEVRHQLSLRYLADPQIAISEVAYLLGYSEPSPFHRAFKRWTGATPSEVRQRAS